MCGQFDANISPLTALIARGPEILAQPRLAFLPNNSIIDRRAAAQGVRIPATQRSRCWQAKNEPNNNVSDSKCAAAGYFAMMRLMKRAVLAKPPKL